MTYPSTSWRAASLSCAVAITCGLTLVGCASPPPPPPPPQPRTTVILLPDEDGSVGAVSVSTAGGSQWLEQAFSVTSAEGSRAPATSSPMGHAAVDSAYGHLLKAQPPKPKSFVLHFLLDKSVLTDESKAQLPAMMAAVRERKPTEITIFGHADSTGTEVRNIRLSAERARVVADLLRRSDPTLDRIDVHFFGDKVPLIETDSRTPEPRNRRAEVMIL